jgi:hypothetical protein
MLKRFRSARRILNHQKVTQKGSTFILVMVCLLFALMVIIPLLGFAFTGVNTGQVAERKSAEIYAADAGIEHAFWQISYDSIKNLPGYNEYDYSTSWNYTLPADVNNQPVNVKIQNVWVPYNITAPSSTQADNIINNMKLITSGNYFQYFIDSNSFLYAQYNVRVSYYPAPTDSQMNVDSIGVWLPQGYEYYSDGSGYESQVGGTNKPASQILTHDGNQAIMWSFGSAAFSSLPGVDSLAYPMELSLSFWLKSTERYSTDLKPEVMAWITENGVDIGMGTNSGTAWDADVKVFHVSSISNENLPYPGTKAETYIAKSGVRSMRSAIAGDYYAGGNTLMIDSDHRPPPDAGIRDQLLASSDSNITAIPADADVSAAYLYWSSWRNESSKTNLLNDTCSNYNNWTRSGSNPYTDTSWGIGSNNFRANSNSGRYLTLSNPVDLHSYYLPGTNGSIIISWDQWVGGSPPSGDGLDYAFSADNGSHWSGNFQAFRVPNIGTSATTEIVTVPGEYLSSQFKMRFYLVGFSNASQYCYVDNIKISYMPPDTGVQFKINGTQVCIDAGGNPVVGTQDIIADKVQVSPDTNGGSLYGYSYSGYKDVTALVRTFCGQPVPPATNIPCNARYTVGGVTGTTGDNWSYAGWSLILIYTSPSTKGHQLYLFDRFLYCDHHTDLDYDRNGQPGGKITGFYVPRKVSGEVNAATITAFVGEGDQSWSGDFLSINAPDSYASHPQDIPDSYKLWDGVSCSASGTDTNQENSAASPNNVWNGQSAGEVFTTGGGVDIDTFTVPWSSNILKEGDTSARIDIYTKTDIWNLVYIILSVRSSATTGGLQNFLIR